MSLHQHHNPYLQYAPVMHHYAPPPQSPAHPPAPPPQNQRPQQQQQQTPTQLPATTVAPNDTYTREPQHTSGSSQAQSQTHGQNQNHAAPLVAQGDWTKNLVHLAKTAELKKHSLTLQLHTAHILSAHTQLETKNKALQDIKEERNRLESERSRLLSCLRQVNEDRDKADLSESTINKEVSELRAKIQAITDGEYSTAKREVDVLRAELGQPPVPTLQETLEEKSRAYLNERRLNGAPAANITESVATPASSGSKRAVVEPIATTETPVKRPRGRPKGSRNKKSLAAAAAAGSSSSGAISAEIAAD